MRRTTIAVAFAAILTLTGCSGSDDDTPSRSKDLAALDFPDMDSLSDYMADHHGGEATMTKHGSLKGEIMVMIESKGFELSDKGETVKVLEEIGHGVDFDYKWATVASNTDSGNWGFRYTADTVQEMTENDVLVDKVWNLAENGVNAAY